MKKLKSTTSDNFNPDKAEDTVEAVRAVPAAFNRLIDIIDTVGKTMAVLLDRLHPVLQSEPDSPNDVKDSEKIECPFSEQIIDQVRRLQDIYTALESALRRLEL